MGSTARIRWPKLARLTLAGIAGAALLLAVPSLLRRPEPPSLEPDIGLVEPPSPPIGRASRRAESRRGTESGRRARRQNSGRRRGDSGGHRSGRDGRRHGPGPPANRAPQPASVSPSAAPSPRPPAAAGVAPPTAPSPAPAPPPAAPAPAPAPSPSSPTDVHRPPAPAEFGFER